MLNLKEIVMWVFLLLVAAGLIYAKGYEDSTETHTKKLNEAQIALMKQKEEHRVQLQETQGKIEGEWRQKNQLVASAAARTVDELRGSNIRLSVKLADATIASVTDGNQCRADGRAELHRETSEFLIGEAQRADAQVKALQATIRNLQEVRHE